MNKEELEKEIAKTKEQLAKLQEALKSKEYNKWKPQNNEEYFYIDTFNDVRADVFNTNNPFTKKILSTLNYFKTEAEAKQEAEKILVRRKLENIAKHLNKGEEIDWNDFYQFKHFIFYDYETNVLGSSMACTRRVQGIVYCLSDKFLDIAIQEIGKERLLEYLRGE